jgi:predicted membrane-bound mannosyltransferase
MSLEKSSISKKWRNAYVLVVSVLVMLIVFFYFFTKQFT